MGTERSGAAKPIEGFGEIAGFGGRIVGDVLRGRVLRFFGMLGTQVFWGANPRAPIGG